MTTLALSLQSNLPQVSLSFLWQSNQNNIIIFSEQVFKVVENFSGLVSEVPGQVVLLLHEFCLRDINTDRIATSDRNKKGKHGQRQKCRTDGRWENKRGRHNTGAEVGFGL